MQTIKKYRLQSEIESLKQGNHEWFKDYLRQVLESDREAFAKADYIAYSINQISNKLSYVSDEIKELQAIKKSLSDSKELAMELTASVLSQEYGINKLDGATVSSITITPEKSKTTQSVVIKDDKSMSRLMGMGYVSFSVDMDAIEKIIETKEGFEELKEFLEVNTITATTPQKIKINNKRSSANSTMPVDEISTIEAAA